MRAQGIAVTISAFLAVSALHAARAQDFDPVDFEGRADYAYFTENQNSLRNLLRDAGSVLARSGESPAIRYGLGFAHYRLGLLLSAGQKSMAAAEMSACIEHLDEAVQSDARFAEAYTLQSACYGQLSALKTLTAMINRPLSGARLDKARELSPRNPRVALVEAYGAYERPRAFGGDKAHALTLFKQAVELFETTPQEPGQPRWGHADAYAGLGRSLLEADDLLGARNALERALILAPEFSAARRMLAGVTTPR